MAALAMLGGTLGFAAFCGAVTATAYASRAPQASTVAMSLLLVAGAVAVLTAAVVAVAHLPRRDAAAVALSARTAALAAAPIGKVIGQAER